MAFEVDKVWEPLPRWVMEDPGDGVVHIILDRAFIGELAREEVFKSLWMVTINPVTCEITPSLCIFSCKLDPLL